MRRQIITPGHLTRLPVTAVFYEPQGIQTVAIQVTPETIGAMSIEFGVEIGVSNHKCLPAAFERLSGKDEVRSIERTLFYGDWLVPLNGEVLVFPADTFWNTFSQDKLPEHAEAENEVAKDIMPIDTFHTAFMTLPADMQHQPVDPV
jgi:hypothetical protein